MRTRVLATLCGLLLLPVSATAQPSMMPATPSGPTGGSAGGASSTGAPPGGYYDPDAPASDEEGGETEGAEVVDEKPGKVKAAPGRDAAPGEVHTVVKGDNLWDLSQRYLGSSWCWPK